MTGAGDWQQHLDPGESLVWTGHPVRTFGITRREGTVGAIAVTIGVVAFVMAFRTLGADVQAGVLWLSLGMAMEAVAILPPILRNARLFTTRYALTDRRALILSATGLRAVPLCCDSHARLAPNDPSSIRFTQDAGSPPETFHRIADPAQVMAHLNRIARSLPPTGDARP